MVQGMGRIKGARQALRRRDAKVDVAKAFELRMLRGLTYKEIAQVFNVCPQRIHQVLRTFEALFQDADVSRWFRENEGHILDGAKLQVLTNMIDPARLGREMPHHLAFAYDKLNNAARLARGESTKNIASLTKLVLQVDREERAATEIQEAKTPTGRDDGPVESSQ